VGADLTPAEAKLQHALRLECAEANGKRSEPDKTKFFFGSRNGAVKKIPIRA